MPSLKHKLEKEDVEIKKRKLDGGLKKSHLSQKMLKLWGLGKISATAIQAFAHAAHDDGCKQKELEELASLGSWGHHTNNIHRDLIRLLQRKIQQGNLGGLTLSPEIVVKVPALDTKAPAGEAEAHFHMFLLHLMIGSFFESYPNLVEHCFAPGKAEMFWNQVAKDDPRLWGSPVAWEKANCPDKWKEKQKKTILLWIHGDGVEFSTDSLLLFTFGGCLNGLQESQASSSGLKKSQSNASVKSGLKQSHVIDTAVHMAGWPKSATASNTWMNPFPYWLGPSNACGQEFIQIKIGKESQSQVLWQGYRVSPSPKTTSGSMFGTCWGIWNIKLIA